MFRMKFKTSCKKKRKNIFANHYKHIRVRQSTLKKTSRVSESTLKYTHAHPGLELEVKKGETSVMEREKEKKDAQEVGLKKEKKKVDVSFASSDL